MATIAELVQSRDDLTAKLAAIHAEIASRHGEVDPVTPVAPEEPKAK